ncbi:NAD(P)-dependent alcohol dehydrogenase [Rhodococcus sp. CX]|uniref:NAD(P)-dependent alcohol dehydrogenase n=1 Tax=Rhodococcus sp. CX TaxID=2789880 RepID=UPI0018CC980C|nr:NAD(P)-dependent alcohol dehydrogenase [Rhodococcus sp. CX]MBH0121382.1 NAD(P)-dependent alcohol dehydrogenase [Rhodococcus sp. CX]
MPTNVNAYGTTSAGTPLTAVTIERRDVGPHDVKIDILFCGICHSDIHFATGELGPLPVSPLVPGHEIVGVVTEVGDQVTKHCVGDRVGIGCMVDSCRECDNCRAGQEQYCLNGHTLVFGSRDRDDSFTQGGYSQMIVANEDFVVHVPESLDPASAAPLLCAGITVYAPLKRWGAAQGKKIGVVGLGGLGHLGVKMAKAMGAEVTVLSRTESKRTAALELGAHDYAATGDSETFTRLANTFDLVLNTVSAPIDINAHLGLLRLGGTLASVGVSTEPLPLNAFALMTNGRNIAGSQFGGIRETQEMLDFCADTGVTAEIELIPAERINEAYERVLSSDVRYRFVVDNASLTK